MAGFKMGDKEKKKEDGSTGAILLIIGIIAIGIGGALAYFGAKKVISDLEKKKKLVEEKLQ